MVKKSSRLTFGKMEISRKINRWKPLRDVVVTANINLLNELQDVRNLSLIHRNSDSLTQVKFSEQTTEDDIRYKIICE